MGRSDFDRTREEEEGGRLAVDNNEEGADEGESLPKMWQSLLRSGVRLRLDLLCIIVEGYKMYPFRRYCSTTAAYLRIKNGIPST